MTNLPILRTEVYEGALDVYPSDSVIPYGPANLTDGSALTAIRISSSQAANWFIALDGDDLAAVTQIGLEIKVNVISRGSSPFVLRSTLQDHTGSIEYGDAGYFEIDSTLPNGVSTLSVTLDQAWVTAHPSKVWNTGGGPYTFDSVRDAMLTGSEVVLSLFGYAGGPYEVDVTEVKVVAVGVSAPDFDGDAIPDDEDPDIDGDGTPNEDDPDDFDPLNPPPYVPQPLQPRFHFKHPIRSRAGTLKLGAEISLCEPGSLIPLAMPVYASVSATEPLGPTWVTSEGVIDFYVDEETIVDIFLTMPLPDGSVVLMQRVWVGQAISSEIIDAEGHTHTAIEVGAIPAGDITEVVYVTQAEFDALVTKPATTLYLFHTS